MRRVVRAFPGEDREFASLVERLVRNADELTPAVLEDIRQRVRSTYPCAELVLQHTLAVITDDRVLYAYRDGTLVHDDATTGAGLLTDPNATLL